LTANPNRRPIRGEGGHAWTLKGKCRFCGMTRVLFKMQNRPDCPYKLPKRKAKDIGMDGNG
jgi:hypothetical protein